VLLAFVPRLASSDRTTGVRLAGGNLVLCRRSTDGVHFD